MIYTNRFSMSATYANPHSIANKAPLGWVGPTIKELTPGQIVWDLKNGKISEAEYTEKYLAKLLCLDREGYDWSQLEGKTLLCWEATGKFCHRRILGEFLQKKGYQVEIN